jgi:aminodeoxyfutalosine synthase
MVHRFSLKEASRILSTHSLVELGFAAEHALMNNRRHVRYLQYQLLRLTPLFKDTGDSQEGIAELLEKADKAAKQGIGEFRLESINTYKISFSLLIQVIETLKGRYPELDVRGLNAQHVKAYSEHEQTSTEEILGLLKTAGLSLLDGRGTGPAASQAHNYLGMKFISEVEWIDLHRAAHQIGLPSEANLTYGFGESWQDRLEQLERIRDLQDETNGFVRLVLVPYQLKHNHDHFSKRESNLEDLKLISIARAFVDNISHISLNWGRFGLEFSQLGIVFGASELHGPFFAEKSKLPAIKLTRTLGKTSLESLIRNASYLPMAHDFVDSAGSRPTPVACQDASLLLYKLENNKELNIAELSSLINDATLLQLGHCSELIKTTLGLKKPSLFAPPVVVNAADFLQPPEVLDQMIETWSEVLKHSAHKAILINLANTGANPGPLRLVEVLRLVDNLGKDTPGIAVTLCGLKALWNLAQLEKVQLKDLLQTFKEVNVISVESSPNESEVDLTSSEIKRIHKTIHDCDMGSIAKAEIQAVYSPDRGGLWQGFLDRLETIRQLQNETPGVAGIKIEPHPMLTIAEYMRALSVARIHLRNVANVIAPIATVPATHRRLSTPYAARAAASFCSFLFGANDAGLCQTNLVKALRIESETLGIPMTLRDARFFSVGEL